MKFVEFIWIDKVRSWMMRHDTAKQMFIKLKKRRLLSLMWLRIILSKFQVEVC